MLINKIFIAFLFPLLLFPLTICVPKVAFHGRISSTPAVEWKVELTCLDCLQHHFTMHTKADGRFVVPLELVPKRLYDGNTGGFMDIDGVQVKVKSLAPLGGQIRSYEWNLQSNFDYVHRFEFGHFAPSPAHKKGLYLRAKFEKPLPEPKKLADALLEEYWLEIQGKEGIGRIGFREMVDPDEWRGQSAFELELEAEKIEKYLDENQWPKLDFYVTKIPKCVKCGQTENEKGEKVLYKKKAGHQNEFMHLMCHEKIDERKETAAHKRKHCNCSNCWKQKHFEEGEDAQLKQECIFHAELKLPILQNGDEPIFTYDFDPTKSKANYNYVQLEYITTN